MDERNFEQMTSGRRKIVFPHSHHKAIWDWLAKHPGDTKRDAAKALELLVHRYPHQCPACSCAYERADEERVFEQEEWAGWGATLCMRFCPLVWGRDNVCPSSSGLYAKWSSLTASLGSASYFVKSKYCLSDEELNVFRNELKPKMDECVAIAETIRDLQLRPDVDEMYLVI